MKILRMAGALIAGYFVMSVAVVAATWLMSLAVPAYGGAGAGAPPAHWIAVNLAYSAVFLATGAYVAQWIAGGTRPVVPLVMGALMVVMSLAQFGQGMSAWPLWYRIGLLVLPMPMAWLGGWFRIRTAHRSAGPGRDTSPARTGLASERTSS